MNTLSPTTAKHGLRNNLARSTYEGGCHALMVGLSETYFAAFYIAVGLSEFGVGLLATIPYLIGSALQLIAPWGVNRVRSYRIWTMWTSALQGISLLAMALMAYLHQVSFAVLLALATVYWASALMTGPAWNTWIEFVVPKRIRARYFSVRMRICQLCLIGSITGSGLLLRSYSSESEKLLVFVGLFALGGLLRLLSVGALHRQIEKPSWLPSNAQQPVQDLEGPDAGKLIKTILPFFVAMQFAVYISGPYFAPFMLKNMGLGYSQFMLLILLGYFGRVITLPWAGKIVKEFGPGRLMLWGAIGIIPMSSVWIFYQSFAWLCVVQVASGAAWACYELATSLVFIERIPSHYRMRVLSWFNTFNGIAMLAGSILGGVILTLQGSSNAGFLSLFLLSGLFRVIAFVWFPFQLVEQNPTPRTFKGIAWPISSPLVNGRSILRPFYIPAASAGNRLHQSSLAGGLKSDSARAYKGENSNLRPTQIKSDAA